MLAIVFIPHQYSPFFKLYATESELVSAAQEYAAEIDTELDECGNRIEDYEIDQQGIEAAIAFLGHDYYRTFEVRGLADIEYLRNYKDHQSHKLAAIISELEEIEW